MRKLYICILFLSGFLLVAPECAQSAEASPISAETPDGIDMALQLKNQADKTYQQQETKTAVELYLEELTTAHDDTFGAEQLNVMAIRLRDGGEPAEAERIFRKLSVAQPRDNAIRLNLAKALVKQEDWEQAIVESEKILKVDELNQQALLIKANSLSKQKNIARPYAFTVVCYAKMKTTLTPAWG